MNKEEFDKSLNKAFSFINWLHETHGINACIAGGCARDLYFGLVPKDIDIVVYGEDDCSDGYQQNLENYIETYFDKDYTPNTLWSNPCIGSFNHYNGPKVKERIAHIWKVYDEDFDILLYRSESRRAVMDAFDFNINQFIINPVTHQAEYYGYCTLEDLVSIRGDHEYSRGEYMEEKHKMLLKLAKEKGIDLPEPSDGWSEFPVGCGGSVDMQKVKDLADKLFSKYNKGNTEFEDIAF